MFGVRVPGFEVGHLLCQVANAIGGQRTEGAERRLILIQRSGDLENPLEKRDLSKGPKHVNYCQERIQSKHYWMHWQGLAKTSYW